MNKVSFGRKFCPLHPAGLSRGFTSSDLKICCFAGLYNQSGLIERWAWQQIVNIGSLFPLPKNEIFRKQFQSAAVSSAVKIPQIGS